MTPLRVHCVHDFDDDARARLEARLGDRVRFSWGASADGVDDLHAVRILVAGRPDPDLLARLTGLESLVIPWAGLPRKTRDALADRPDLAVHNLHHNAAATAEMAMALLLAAAKHVLPLDRSLRRGDWTPRYEPFPTLGLAGRTMLVLGYGAIGRRVARMGRGFDMRVIALRRDPPPRAEAARDENDVEIRGPDSLGELLPDVHALMVCVPLTSETEGLVDAAALGAMPDDAVIVNVGRGPVIDETALYEALRDGTIGAAGIDVWYEYPPDAESRAATPPSSHPFGELDHVVMSPHRAGTLGARESERLRMDALADLLEPATRGEPMPNRVDPARGY